MWYCYIYFLQHCHFESTLLLSQFSNVKQHLTAQQQFNISIHLSKEALPHSLVKEVKVTSRLLRNILKKESESLRLWLITTFKKGDANVCSWIAVMSCYCTCTAHTAQIYDSVSINATYVPVVESSMGPLSHGFLYPPPVFLISLYLASNQGKITTNMSKILINLGKCTL